MKIGRYDITGYSICAADGGECAFYAADELRHYIKLACGAALDIVSRRKSSKQIVLILGYDGKADGFRGYYKKGNFFLEGQSGRGVLYAAYDFLERFFGWRFFAAPMCFKGEETGKYMSRCEKAFAPMKDIAENEYYEENPVILFRDIFGHATVDESWCVKNRINGDMWRLKNVPRYMGGSERFAAEGGHSFSELLPADRYFEKHPEYFALVNGRRKGGAGSQICMTSKGALNEVIKNAEHILENAPGAKYVSVSQNDNNNFCTCENCRKAEEKGGRANLLFGFVNKVAEGLEKKYPHVKIHTFAYDSTAQDCNIALHKNVVLQYCLRCCRGHTFYDSACRTNAILGERIRKLSKDCNELFIYDYISSESHIFQFMPDIFRLREKMRFLADCKVKGIYSETDIFCQNSPCMEELRAYAYAKLTWNPYMSENEYERHINEFLQGYYGAGWKHIRRYLEIWAEATDGAHYDSVLGNVADENGRDMIGENGIPVRCDFIAKEKIESTCAALENELVLAEEQAGDDEKDRIKILRVAPLWYRLFHTMKGVLRSGSEQEKAKAVADNRELCSLMRKYCMKYTWSIAMSETTAMYKDFTLPPSDWNYWERDSLRTVFDEHLGIRGRADGSPCGKSR